MPERRRLLLVEDDPAIAGPLEASLEAEGFEVTRAGTGAEALERAAGNFDALVLDLGLPGLDGLEVCRRVRRRLKVPILLLTARAEEAQKLAGFEAGADDYVTKPFSTPELVARLRALIRRAEDFGGPAGPEAPLVLGGLVVDRAARRATLDGQELALAGKEFDLLAFLAAHPGVVHSREALMTRVWGYTYDGFGRTVDTHVARLRRKLGEDPRDPRFLRTVVREGYCFTGDEGG